MNDLAATLFMCAWTLIFFVITLLISRQLLREARKIRWFAASPRLTVPVTVHARDESRRRVTFRTESGDLFSLRVEDAEARFLLPGSTGSLTFRGKTFLRFDPQK